MELLAGRYQMLDLVARGRQGDVYKARDLWDGDTVALKLLNNRPAPETMGSWADLRHPYVVRLLDSGSDGGRAYLAMEYVAGPSLRDAYLDGGEQRLLPLVSAVCAALEAAHSRGLLHGDLKPSNILIHDGPGNALTPKLADFGLARRLGVEPESFTGTLAYAAPELLRGRAPDQRSDLYSIGACLYEVLTGERPFNYPEMRSLVKAHLEISPRDPRELNSSVSTGFARTVLSLLSKEPAQRPSSAGEVAARLGCAKAQWPMGDPTWVGRRRQTEFLRRLGELATQRRGSLVLVVGEEGIGKSTLLGKLYFEWGLQGLPRVVVGQGIGVCLTDQLLQRSSALTGGAEGPLEAKAQSPPSVQDAVLAFLRAVESAAGSEHLLLIMDDLGRADEAFLPFLQGLLPLIPAHPLLAVAGVDTEGLKRLRTAIPEVLDPPHVRRVHLRPLLLAETERLAASLLHRGRLEPPVARLVHGASGGNPGLAREVVGHLAREGFFTPGGDGWQQKPLPAIQELSRDLSSIVASRLQVMAPAHRRVLGAIALLGSRAPQELIADVTDLDPETFGQALQALQESDIIARSGRVWAVRQGVMAHAAERAIEPGERLELHRAAVRAIKSLHGTDPRWAQALASHLAASGERPEALRESLSAATKAFEEKRYGQALELYGLAQGCLGEDEGKARSEILRRQSACYAAVGRSQRAAEHLRDALELPEVEDLEPDEMARLRLSLARALADSGQAGEAEEHIESILGVAQLNPAIRAEALAVAAQVAAKTQTWQRAEEFASASLTLAAEAGDENLRARAENTLGVARMMMGNLQEARHHLEESYTIRTKMGDALGAGRCSMNLSILCRRLGRYEEAMRHVEESLVQFAGAGAVAWEAKARNVQGMVALCTGHPSRAASAFEESAQAARRCGLWRSAGLSMNSLGLALTLAGDWAAAGASFRRVLSLGRMKSDGYLRRVASSNLGDLYLATGDLEVAEGWFSDAAKIAEEQDDPLGEGISALGLGRIHMERGELDAAERHLTTAGEALVRAGDQRALLHARCALAELRLAQGKLAEAAEEVESANRALGESGVAEQGMVLRTLGKVRAKKGDEDGAGQAFKRCLELLEATEAVEETALTQLELGRWLMSRSHTPGFGAAERYLASARNAFHKLGARRRAQEAEKLLNQLAEPPASISLPETDAHKLSSLYRMMTLVNTAETSEGLLEQVLDLAVHAVHGERGLVILLDEESGELKVRVSTDVDGATIADARRMSETVVRQVAGVGKPMFSPDALADVRFSELDSIRLNRIACFACVPLARRGEILGTIYVDSRNLGHRFTESDVAYLSAFAHQAATAMENLRLREALERENEYLKRQLKQSYAFDTIVGQSQQMQAVYATMSAVIESPVTVLLQGETGTGKELIARAIHYNGPRAKGRFVPVDCGALPESLLESELFGYAKGAFTGAVRSSAGLLQSADGGTIFLDEITDMTSNLQSKFLRVLQTGEVKPVGRTTTQKVDVRVISATNKDLEREMKTGRFREDLYYRLKVVTIRVPPLRERAQDIPLLAAHFLEHYNKRLGKEVRTLGDDALAFLCAAPWPGNVRELEHVVEAAVALCPGNVITIGALSRAMTPQPPAAYPSGTEGAKTLKEAKRALERHYVLRALETTGWSIRKAAVSLGVERRQMQRLAHRHGFGEAVSA